MGKLAFLFLVLAGFLAYDAITFDGAYSKAAWAEIRAAGSSLEDRVGGLVADRPATSPRADGNGSGL